MLTFLTPKLSCRHVLLIGKAIRLLERPPMWEGHSYIVKSSFSLPRESSADPLWRQNTRVRMQLYYHFIKQFLLSCKKGRWVGLNQKGYFTYHGEEMRTSLIPPYKLRKNRLDSLTSCSAQFCVGSCTTPSPVPFWASSRSNATAICGVWFALPHPPSPRAEPRAYFYVKWTFSPGSAACLTGINAPLRDHLPHNGTVPTPHVCSPHEDTRDRVPRCMERHRVPAATRPPSSMKPRRMEKWKNGTLLGTVTPGTAQEEVHAKSPRAPPNARLLVPVWAHVPVHAPRPRILW